MHLLGFGNVMNWEAIGAVGEILGAGAVFVSLIYLAIQIRQNTQSVRNSTHLGNTDLWSQLLLRISDNNQVQAYARGLGGDEDLDGFEFAQFMMQCRVLFLGLENQFYQYCNGSFDETTYQSYKRNVSEDVLVYPGFLAYWDMKKHQYTPDFVEHIDALISQTLNAPIDLRQGWRDRVAAGK